MKQRILAATVAALAFAIAEVTSLTTDANARAISGIRGVAMVGPVSPVSRPGQPNTKPLGGAIITVQPQNGGAEIARTVADSEGRFSLTVNPGTYKVVPLPPQPGRYPYAAPFVLSIPSGVFVYRQINYDSGIR